MLTLRGRLPIRGGGSARGHKPKLTYYPETRDGKSALDETNDDLTLAIKESGRDLRREIMACHFSEPCRLGQRPCRRRLEKL